MSDFNQPCDIDLGVMKRRSPWPIFHGPVILPYILKTFWYMNTILQDYESVWHIIWPQNKCKSLWPIFNGPVVLPYIFEDYLIYKHPYFGIMSQYDPMFDLKINVGHCDLYFMVQWFCLISILKTVWCMNRIMSQYDLTFDLKIDVGRFDLYFMVQWFCLISWSLLIYEDHTFGLWVSMTRCSTLK